MTNKEDLQRAFEAGVEAGRNDAAWDEGLRGATKPVDDPFEEWWTDEYLGADHE